MHHTFEWTGFGQHSPCCTVLCSPTRTREVCICLMEMTFYLVSKLWEIAIKPSSDLFVPLFSSRTYQDVHMHHRQRIPCSGNHAVFIPLAHSLDMYSRNTGVHVILTDFVCTWFVMLHIFHRRTLCITFYEYTLRIQVFCMWCCFFSMLVHILSTQVLQDTFEIKWSAYLLSPSDQDLRFHDAKSTEQTCLHDERHVARKPLARSLCSEKCMCMSVRLCIISVHTRWDLTHIAHA